MRTYDEAYEHALKQRPFSNGTEGYAWMGNWCDACIHDKPARDGDGSDGCPLILVALMDRTPSEWINQADPQTGMIRLGDSYHCIEFRDEDEGEGGSGEPQPIPDPPGQLLLVPREPYVGVRMYALPEQREQVSA